MQVEQQYMGLCMEKSEVRLGLSIHPSSNLSRQPIAMPMITSTLRVQLESELARLGRTARERRRSMDIEARVGELTKVRSSAHSGRETTT